MTKDYIRKVTGLAVVKFLANGGKITKCPTRYARGHNGK